MKKHIVSMLIVLMLATPCLAQEIEPEGIFSLHGTQWQALPMAVQILPFPSLVPLSRSVFSFYGGEEYPEGSGYGYYIDMLVCSIFKSSHRKFEGGSYTKWYGVLQPIGTGIVVEYHYEYIPYNIFPTEIDLRIGLLIKVSGNWAPPEFVSISPNHGEQGTILTEVKITCLNTNFDTIDGIYFYPGEGIDINNCTVISDTQLEFDLTIAADAPTGLRDIDFWYVNDNGYFKNLGGNQAFEVIGKN
jgi:hypothetical protein